MTTHDSNAMPRIDAARDRRRHRLFVILAGFFITNALLAELIGGKLFAVPTGVPFLGQANYHVTMTCGIVLWPMVFIMTDIINEYFGRRGVRLISILCAAMIAYAFVGLGVVGAVPAVDFSPIDAASFNTVFRQSQFIIVGSIVAFLVAQLVDVSVFWIIRRRTGHRMLWLRATGSTVVSQLIDSYIVGFIGLYLPHALHQRWPDMFAAGGLTFSQFVEAQTAGYLFKLVVAVVITPLLYVVHAIINRHLGEHSAEQLIEATAATERADDRSVMR